MIKLESRIKNIVEWFSKNHSSINYVSYNNVLEYFIETNNDLRKDWEKIRREYGSDFIFRILKDNQIPFLTKSEYDKNIFEEDKKKFMTWMKDNHEKPDRLSYTSILKYIDEHNEVEIKRIFSKIYNKIKQEGLIKLFDDNGLNFYIQDNKKDFEKIKKQLIEAATAFYKENKFTPGWVELEQFGFGETNYLRGDGWNINWTINDLNEFYLSNNLPIIPSKSEKSVDELLKTDINEILDEVVLFFGNIPTLRNLKYSENFYDLVRYIRLVRYHHKDSLTENQIYRQLLEKKFGKNYFKLTQKLISLEGFWCDSIHELIVFNYLYLNNKKHKPHLTYSNIIGGWDTNYICDTLIDDDIVCEIAGYNPNLDKHKSYWSKMLEKRTMCLKNQIQFLQIEGYRFINTKLESFLDYIHEFFSCLFENMKKPNFFEVIKSQHTIFYLKDIFSFFENENHLTIEKLKERVSNESYRFFMNTFQSIKNFRKKYEKGLHKDFTELKNIKINFDEKKISKVMGQTKNEKINRGLILLSDLIKKEKMKFIPSSSEVEKFKDYRVINDLFRLEKGSSSFWVSINKKESGYNELCKILGYEIEPSTNTPDYYSNTENLYRDLLHMKKVGQGFWIGMRHNLYKEDFVIRKIHTFINQKVGGVGKFREKYYEILEKVNFDY